MLGSLDFLAPKARQGKWLLSLLSDLPKAYAAADLPEGSALKLETYPGLAYAKSLVLFDAEEDAKGDDAVR